MNKIISFKSTPENFVKEHNDIKNNTARFTADWTKERWDNYFKATHIQIKNAKNNYAKFTRKIRDKTEFQGLVIITWEEKNKKLQSKR